MIVKLLTEQHLEFLSLKGGCTDSSESIRVIMLHCWKHHVAAQMWDTKEKWVFDNNQYLTGRAKHVIVIPWVVHMYMEIIHEL